MNHLMLIAEFLAKSDLKKATLAVYFWSTLLLLEYKVPSAMSEETFCQLGILIIVAAFFSNVATHYIRNRYGNGNANGGTHAKPADPLA